METDRTDQQKEAARIRITWKTSPAGEWDPEMIMIGP